MKISRNDPCPCGSGKKYKKCHYPRMLQEILTLKSYPEYLDEKKRLVGRPFLKEDYQGKSFRAVGSKLYALPLNATAHEFFICVLKEVLGPAWLIKENKKSRADQQIIARWLNEMNEHLKSPDYRVEDTSKGIKSIEPTGNVQALLCLAYDVYILSHCMVLPKKLIKRLKGTTSFQGAKYEIAVASFFARAGFNIEWIEEKSSKHCEFIATHSTTNEKIAVEAKSRHRQGVLNQDGRVKPLEEIKTGISGHFNQALEQAPEGMPFIAFLDLNLPLEVTDRPTQEVSWFQELKRTMGKLGTPSSEKPDDFNALFVTNFSWHYKGLDIAKEKGRYAAVMSLHPKNPIKDSRTIGLLENAVNQYGYVPHDV